jgi:putative FmdB family regulatory protein
MPTYEYVCRNCGKQLEVVQSFHDDALTVCPNCNGELKKVFGSVGIVFKGSGFYKNDSRNASSSVTPPSSSDTKTESAPATTPSTSSSESPATPAAPSTTPTSTPTP